MRHLVIYLAGVSIGLYFGIVAGGLMMWGFLQPHTAPTLPFSMPPDSSLYLMAASLALHVLGLLMIIRFRPREEKLNQEEQAEQAISEPVHVAPATIAGASAA